MVLLTPFQRIEDTIIHPDGKPAEHEEGDSEEKPADAEDKTAEETEQPADDTEAPAEKEVEEPVTEETTEEQPIEDADADSDAEKSEETPEVDAEDKIEEPEEPVAEEAEEEQPSEEAEEPAADEQTEESEEPAAEDETKTLEDAEIELDAHIEEDFGLRREWFEIPNDFLEEEGPYAIHGYEEPIFAPFDGPLYEPFVPMVDPFVPLEEAMAVPVAPVVPEWWNPDHFVGRMPEFGVFPPLAPFSPLELDNAAMGDRAAYRNNNEEVMVLRTPNFSIAW